MSTFACRPLSTPKHPFKTEAQHVVGIVFSTHCTLSSDFHRRRFWLRTAEEAGLTFAQGIVPIQVNRMYEHRRDEIVEE
jgi:hypothetical protein